MDKKQRASREYFNAVSRSDMKILHDHPRGLSVCRTLEEHALHKRDVYAETVRHNRSTWINDRAEALWHHYRTNDTPELKPDGGDYTPSWNDCVKQARDEVDAAIKAQYNTIEQQKRQRQQRVMNHVRSQRSQMRQDIAHINKHCAEMKQENRRAYIAKKDHYIALAAELGIKQPAEHIRNDYNTMQSKLDDRRKHELQALHQRYGFTYAAQEMKLKQKFKASQSY